MDQVGKFECTFTEAQSAYQAYGSVPIRPPNRPGFDLATDAAWQCVNGFVRHRMMDGTVMVPDTQGRWHRFAMCHPLYPEGDLTALAFDDKGGWAMLSPALAETLITASFGIWSNPKFESWLGDATRIDPIADDTLIPLGFEDMVTLTNHRLKESKIVAARRKKLDTLRQRICPVRGTIARATAWHAARWIWAHEAGHLFGGHHLLNLGGRADLRVQAVTKRGRKSAPPSLAHVALEIIADRFATRLIGSAARGASPTQLSAIAAGGLLSLSLFETEHTATGQVWTTTTHPGTWIRARIFVDELTYAARQALALRKMMSSLADWLGPYGLWLIPAIEGQHQNIVDAFADEARECLTPYKAVLQTSDATPIPDVQGMSTDLFPASPN